MPPASADPPFFRFFSSFFLNHISMHQVLDTPELLQMIMSHFEQPVKPKDVLGCALVARNWAWIALELLWRRKDYNDLRLQEREIEIIEKMVRMQLEVGN
jgi:hypothetical protein